MFQQRVAEKTEPDCNITTLLFLHWYL